MPFPTTNLSDSSDDDDDLVDPNNEEDQENPFQINVNSSVNEDSSGSDEKDTRRKVVASRAPPPPGRETTTRRKFSASSSEDEGRPPNKRPYLFNERIRQLATDTASPIGNDNKGRSMLAKMGFRDGKGLGKDLQGRVEPVEVSKQRGRRGLGLTVPELTPANLKWDSSMEITEVEERVDWLDNKSEYGLMLPQLRSWATEGPKDLHIENMTDFCDSTLLENMLEGKNMLDNLTSEELLRARSRSNPFETLKNGIFLNRAALKMANIDVVFDKMFTQPTNSDGSPMVGHDELLYFADVCAGPGGFSEYVLWRLKWRCKGFGFTLKGDCDFKLSDFFAGSPETFEPYYGVKDDGDVFDPDNIVSLTELVMKGTDSKGVHFMMADGGFSVEGQENIQELLSKQLYLCQFLVALNIVRTGGHFLCKLFDLLSPFSAGLVYLMYRAFESVSLFKPNTSRPANSERYIICKRRRSDAESIREYMTEINLRLQELKLEDPKQDVTHIVPMNVLMGDENFFNYLVHSNNSLGQRQVVNLNKIRAFCRDPNLMEGKQVDLRMRCLKAWEIPAKPRSYNQSSADEVTGKILGHDRSILNCKPTKLVPGDLEKIFPSIYDWKCITLGSNELNFYLGLGRKKVFKWNTAKGSWIRDPTILSELSPGTLIFGEVVKELKGEGVALVRISALHIIDGISIGYENIATLDYSERLKTLSLYCKALERQSGPKFPVRVKPIHEFSEINHIFQSLTYRCSKQMQPSLVIENDQFSVQPKGIAFVNTTKKPWRSSISKSTGHRYFINLTTGVPDYPNRIQGGTSASVNECIERLVHWQFEEGVGLQQESPIEGVLHKDALLDFIASIRQPPKP